MDSGVEELRAALQALPPRAAPAAAVSPPADIDAAVRSFGTDEVDWAVSLAAECMEDRGEKLPSWWLSQQPSDQVHRCFEKASLDVLRMLHGQRVSSELTADQREIVRRAADLGMPVGDVATGMRELQERWSTSLALAIEGRGPAGAGVRLVMTALRLIARYFDALAYSTVSAYVRYREEKAERAAADRRSFVLALADRGAPSARELAQALGVVAEHEHLALVCWAGPGEVLDGIGVERWADRVAHRLGCSGRTVVAIDDTVTVVWLTSQRPFAGRQRDRVVGLDEVGAAGVAVGVPASGPAGFRRTLVAARDAQRFAARGGRPPRLVHYEDVALPALLGEDPERSRWFVQEALGGLAAEDGATAVLRRTVRVHLDTNGSLVRTAAVLHVHRNTVIQRLARAESARGAPLAERALDLHVALALAEADGADGAPAA